MHSTFRKLNFLIAFGAFFAALSLSGGCTNLFSSNSPNNDAPAQIQAKEGYGIITGSVPAANSVSPRTAMPDPDKTTPDEYKVFAQNGSTKIEANVNQATKKFSIQLPYGTWNVTAQGLNAGKVIYSDTKKVTLSAANSQVDLEFTLGYSTNPDDGLGETSLSVSFPPPSSSNITAVEYILSKGSNKIEVKISEEELTAGKFTIKRIFEDLGTYSLTINFYGDFGNLIYLINQKVQVYANLCTDKFVGNAPYISGGDIVVTEALLKEFENTTLYVDATTGNDTNTGTRFDPLKTFYRAVEMVNNASVEPTDGFRIFLQTNVSDGAFLELKEGKKLTVASADGTARTIDSLERQFDVAATSELTVNDIKFQKMSFRVAGTLEMNGCEISGNTKNEQGGAIHVASGGKVTITNSKLLNNEASNSGGAVYVDGGTFEIKGSEITGNEAKQSAGGGIFVKESTFTMSGCTVRGNTAVTNGGGVYVVGGTLTMESGEITGNAATNNGGGVYVDNNALFKMQGGTITENKIEYSGAINASTTASYNGGGVYISASGEFTMSGGTISKNTATYSGAIADVYTVFNGGGVYISASGEFTMSGGEISGNKASVSGGGVSVDGGTFTLSGGAEISANTTNGDGGGVHISVGTFEMTGGTISGNEATNTSTAQDAWASGGGVFVYDGSFTMSGGEISGNKAKSSGGGVYVTDSGAFEMQAGTISGNTANGGGGVAVNIDGELTISGGTVSGNHAEYAGGVCIDNRSTFTMSGGEISGNEATSNAGGVFVQKETTFTMEAGTISNNTSTNHAGGVYVDVDDSTFTMKRGTISGNTSNLGGGVYIIGDPSTGKYGTFTMENGTISGNTANTDGGGVYVENAVFTMENGTITENEAKGDSSVMFGGGGVYIVNTMSTSSLPTFTMKDGVVSKNKANMGGGIYALFSSEFVMSGGKFSENHAAQQGSGAYINNTSTFKMSGEAKFEEDDDVYLYGEVTTPAKITVTGTLNATSPVATITPSSYEDGREILTAGAGITKEQMQTICRQFALTPEPLPDGATEYTATRWGISPASTDYTKGVLSKVLNELYVSENGSDNNLGTRESPLKTMEKAIETLKEYNDGASEYTIYVHGTITPGTTAGAAMADISGFTEPLNLTIQPFPEDSQATLNGNNSTRCVNVPATETGLTLTLENLVLTGGAVTNSSGGAVTNSSGGAAQILAGTVTMTGCEVKSSSAYFGGGLYLANGEFTLEDCEITGNNASSTGGGISLESGTLTMDGGTVNLNTAEQGAGVYVAAGTFTMQSDAHVYKNTASSTSTTNIIGGGVLVRTGGTLNLKGSATISENTARNGAGVYITDSASQFTMSGGTVSKNIADNWGGGIYVSSGTFTMQSGEISENKANYGGGVRIDSGMGTIDGSSSTITGNTACYGGGICVMSIGSSTQFTMSNGEISDNTAGYGAGVHIGGAIFAMSGGKINKNNAIIEGGNASGGVGGGVYIASGRFTMSSSATVSENTAYYYGGGVYISSEGTFLMEKGTISENTANNGGGVYVNISAYIAGSAFVMSGGEIYNNTASSNGGGVYVASGTFALMSDGTINANKAPNGGGVYITGSDSQFTMSGGEISHHTLSTTNGGGVYVNSGIFTMQRGTVYGNAATNGGGIYISSGTFEMEGGRIGSDSANAVNEARSYGGGVYVDYSGKFMMSGNAIISGNEATRAASGVYVNAYGFRTATFTMSGGAKVAEDNYVYLYSSYSTASGDAKITVAGELTAETPVATIEPAHHNAGVQVLSADTGITITQDVCEKFALSDDDYTIAPNDAGTYGVLKVPSINIIYLDSSNGDDTNSGASASQAVATLTKAIELYDANSAEKIMFCSAYTLPATEQNLLDRSSKTHLTLMRYDGSSDVSGAYTLGFLTIDQANLVVTISNVTIDGNKANCSSGSYLLIPKASNAQVTLGKNAYLQNNLSNAVYAQAGSVFILDGGEISGNDGNYGGALYIYNSTFTMRDGKITGNTTKYDGGGVYLYGGTFTMDGGEISGNKAASVGGGVSVRSGTFTMNNGTITGNTANSKNGVYGTFIHNGGTVQED